MDRILHFCSSLTLLHIWALVLAPISHSKCDELPSGDYIGWEGVSSSDSLFFVNRIN